MKKHKLWALLNPKGTILPETISDVDKADPFWKMFNFMDEEFRTKYWKKPKESIRALRKMGYRSIGVKVVKMER
jgi:hypothetical protein